MNNSRFYSELPPFNPDNPPTETLRDELMDRFFLEGVSYDSLILYNNTMQTYVYGPVLVQKCALFKAETFHSIHAKTSALVSVLTNILNLFSGISSEPIRRVPHPR